MLMDKEKLEQKFNEAMSYTDYVSLAESLDQRMPWDQRHSQLELTNDQNALISSFEREMNVLCLTGTWCGDCALQGSAMQRIAEANEKIHLRFLQREDEHADLIVKSQINQGFRVPVSWFMAEDFEPVGVFGDRTLSRYRSMARNALGEHANVLAEAPADPVREVLSEMIDEFERVNLLLRISPRLREKHGD